MGDSKSNKIVVPKDNTVHTTSEVTKPTEIDSYERNIDVLDLPPRSEVHQKQSKIQFKIKQPLMRLIIVFVLLLLVFTVYYQVL